MNNNVFFIPKVQKFTISVRNTYHVFQQILTSVLYSKSVSNISQ